MKKTQLIIPILLLSLLSSCLPDDETNPDKNDDRDKITGTWHCTDKSPTYGEQSYSVSIEKHDRDSTKVEIINFNGFGAWSSAVAIMNGLKLNLYSQTMEGHNISGEGIISSNFKRIDWTYEVVELNYNGEKSKEIVTAIFTR